MKAQAIVTSQGRIVSLDIAVNYCHDMKLFKMSRRNIGQAAKILADSGYQGIMKMYSQAQTPRKSSKLKPLTLEDKTYNHTLSKERIKVENIFAKVKTFKIFSTTYRNRRKRFGLRMNLIAGMINRELGFQFRRKSILSKKDGGKQSANNKEERLKQVQQFTLKNEAELGDNLLIVDDIYTTGATIAQIRKLLEEKGIKNIKSFSLAR